MTVTGALQPRDHHVAARTVSTLSMVASAVTIVFALGQPAGKAGVFAIGFTVVLASAAIVAGWMMRYLSATHELAWAACPFLAIAVIVTLDVWTSHGSVVAQISFFFPALYGASQLTRPGAATVTAAAVIGDAVVILATTPARTAALDLVYVSAALVTTASLLIGSGKRQDAPVTQLRRLAAIGPLTGLATRRLLDRAAQSALSGAASGYGNGLTILDIDDFKSVNDRYGHPGGDDVLVQLAHLMSVVAAKTISSAGWVETRSRCCCAVVHSPPWSHARAPTQARDLRALYVAADAALCDAKRAGRNRVCAAPTITATSPAGNDTTSLNPRAQIGRP